MQGKKWIIGALIAGFIMGNGIGPAQASSILGKVIKGGVIGYVVDATAGPLNDGINAVTAKYGVSTTDATKVVPIISVGDGSRAGAGYAVERLVPPVVGRNAQPVNGRRVVAQLAGSLLHRHLDDQRRCLLPCLFAVHDISSL